MIIYSFATSFAAAFIFAICLGIHLYAGAFCAGVYAVWFAYRMTKILD